MSRKKMREFEAKQADRWDVAMREALEHFRTGRYNEGEGAIRAIDQDIQGGIAIEKCYLECFVNWWRRARRGIVSSMSSPEGYRGRAGTCPRRIRQKRRRPTHGRLQRGEHGS